MPVPVEADVKVALEPFNDRVRRAVGQGFRAYVQKRGGGNLFKRTDAAEIFDCVIRAAMAEFNGAGDVTVFKTRATARFLFGTVLVRFKKADSKGRGTNLSTRANSQFLNPRLPFGDAPEAMKVEVCWKLNDLGTSFHEIVVTARDGERVLWSYEMPGGAQTVLDFPTPSLAPAPERKRIATLKPGKQRKGQGKAS